MMFEYTILVIGIVFVSGGLGYACWVRVRAIRLTEDLFAKRDELFDLAADLGMLHDEGYRLARQHINSLIRLTNTISVPVIYFLYCSPLPKADPPRCEDQRLQQAVDQTMVWVTNRIGTYLMRETAIGIVITLIACIAVLISKQNVKEKTQRGVSASLPYGVPERLAPIVRDMGCA
ncbi:MAG: hypothetical protein KAV82_14810 [Phycisphaerae bacterium]|nr:hypothetical protein [Phycisphaerae bacterium]